MTKEQQLQTILLSVQSLDNKLAKERALIANYADEIETFVNTAQADQETAILSLDSLQAPLDALNVTQSSIDTTLALAENKVNQADSRVTSISNDSSNTRAVVNTVLQQTVHPDVIWTEGSDTYSIPGGAVPVYESIQTQLTSLDASAVAVAGLNDTLVPADAQIYASTHASDPAYLPRDAGDAVVTADGAAVKFWGSEAGGGHTVQFVSSDAKGTPTYDLAGRAVTLSASYMPVSNPVNSITLVDQTLIVAVRMQAGSAAYANDRVLIGYGQWSYSDNAFVSTVSSGRWKINFVKHSTYTTSGKNVGISPVNASTIMSQVHDFVLAFAFRSATQDFLVRWVILATDGSTLEEGPAYVVSGDYGDDPAYITNPDPGVHTFGLGHQSQYTITGAGVKDVRVYPVPLDETALNAEFDATVALITA